MRKRVSMVMVLGFWASCLVWAPAAWAAGAAIDEATNEQKKTAQKLFVEAKKAYDDKSFEKALDGFNGSYDVVASPNSLLMVARTLNELDEVEKSYETYQEVIRVAEQAAAKDPKYGQAGEAARKELEGLRPRLGFLSLTVVGATSDTQIYVNDKLIERDRWNEEVVLRSGTATVSAKAPGKSEYHEEVSVGGETTTLRVDLASLWAPPPSSEPLVEEDVSVSSGDLLGLDMRTWSYIAGGVGVAGAVTFGVFGAMNRSKYNSLESDCPAGRCPTDRSDDVNAGKRYQTIANVGLAVGIVGLGTGTVLYILSRDKDGGREEPTTQVGLGPGSISVQGTF